MTTQHFNGLTEAQQERLVLLAEECSEVVKVVMKILRHGYDSDNNGAMESTNRGDLEKEIGHVRFAMGALVVKGDVSGFNIDVAFTMKARTIGPYMHHQEATKAPSTEVPGA